MKIVFISNNFSLHQEAVSDLIASKNGVDYLFIEAAKSGSISKEKYVDKRDYVISFQDLQKNFASVKQQILNADLVIMGGLYANLIMERLQQDRLTFVYSERIYKTSNSLLKLPYHSYKFGRYFRGRNNLYLLCASAFSSRDFALTGCFRNKAVKWGYFTSVPNIDIEKNLEALRGVSRVKILFCARFSLLKHPELPVLVAKRLRDKGIDFELNMYGEGEQKENISALIKSLHLEDRVHLCGRKPNSEILLEFQRHHIFLFTSDKNEGWGAVANEAMSNGCAIVASSRIGSIPFLVKHKENGLIFRDRDEQDLYNKVLFLIENPRERERMARNAYKTMKHLWSPEKAVENLFSFIDDIKSRRTDSISKGPCSKAPLLKNNWFEKNENI